MSNRRSILQSPGLGRAIGDHEERVGDLERAANRLGIEFVYLASRAVETLTDDDQTVWFDFQGGSSTFGAPALTNASDVFELGLMSSGDAAGKYGLQINEPGVNLAFVTIGVASELADAAQKAQHMEYNLEGVGTFGASSWLFSGNFDASVYGNQSITQLWSVDDDGPAIIGVGAANDRGTGDVIAQAFLVVLRGCAETMLELTGGSATLF